jgi:putative acetyltransferase
LSRSTETQSEPMEIRDESLGDAEAIAEVTTTAFRGAEHSSGTEAKIVGALRDAGALTISLVAVEGGSVVGHVAVSPVLINGQAGHWLGLGPVSVDPARQGHGIGTALIKAALDRLREMRAHGCVVLGDPAFYARFGFSSHAELRYGDIPPCYFQRIVFAGSPPKGSVTYHSAFEAS